MVSDNSILRLSYLAWVKKFKPIKNGFDSRAGVHGYLYQPRGKELEFVNCFHNSQIWTLVIMDLSRSASWEISSGIHFVNREGFLITEKPLLDNISVHIQY